MYYHNIVYKNDLMKWQSNHDQYVLLLLPILSYVNFGLQGCWKLLWNVTTKRRIAKFNNIIMHTLVP